MINATYSLEGPHSCPCPEPSTADGSQENTPREDERGQSECSQRQVLERQGRLKETWGPQFGPHSPSLGQPQLSPPFPFHPTPPGWLLIGTKNKPRLGLRFVWAAWLGFVSSAGASRGLWWEGKGLRNSCPASLGTENGQGTGLAGILGREGVGCLWRTEEEPCCLPQ